MRSMNLSNLIFTSNCCTKTNLHIFIFPNKTVQWQIYAGFQVKYVQYTWHLKWVRSEKETNKTNEHNCTKKQNSLMFSPNQFNVLLTELIIILQQGLKKAFVSNFKDQSDLQSLYAQPISISLIITENWKCLFLSTELKCQAFVKKVADM